MKTKSFKKFLSFILCLILIAASVSAFSGCSDENDKTAGTTKTPDTSETETVFDDGDFRTEEKTVGSGSKTIILTVDDGTNVTKVFTVLTDEEKVGKALLDLGLISGEEGAFGLYVKTVDGVTMDYETQGLYWALYEGDKYASAGIDSLDVTDGMKISLRAEK